jgi:hypothetical protein
MDEAQHVAVHVLSLINEEDGLSLCLALSQQELLEVAERARVRPLGLDVERP